MHKKTGEYVPVLSMSGSLVVNLGDLVAVGLTLFLQNYYIPHKYIY